MATAIASVIAYGYLSSTVESADLVFPRPRRKPLSDMTLLKPLREMGIAAVPHGFPGRASVPWLGQNAAGTRYSTPNCSQIVHGCVVILLAPSRGGIASAAIMRRELAEVQPTDASLPVERFVEAGERLRCSRGRSFTRRATTHAFTERSMLQRQPMDLTATRWHATSNGSQLKWSTEHRGRFRTFGGGSLGMSRPPSVRLCPNKHT